MVENIDIDDLAEYLAEKEFRQSYKYRTLEEFLESTSDTEPYLKRGRLTIDYRDQYEEILENMKTIILSFKRK